MKSNDIQSVAFIGLGALGINFAQDMIQHAPHLDICIIADKERIQRYKEEGIYYNDRECKFSYHDDEEQMTPVDLAIFCTKFHGLSKAIASMKHQIGPNTLIMSAINGISSEEVLAQHFKKENIIYTVAQGMDATKIGNRVTCHNIGELCFGDVFQGAQAEAIKRIDTFFQSLQFPHSIKTDILHHQWGKFMLNVGLNQVVALHQGTYQSVQEEGEARNQMVAAMQEVVALSKCNGVELSEAELWEWMAMSDSLSPTGKPSMAQDVDAHRKTEVELFAGTVLKLAKDYQLETPMNQYLFDEITKLEASYL